jgi:hypothetical protein
VTRAAYDTIIAPNTHKQESNSGGISWYPNNSNHAITTTTEVTVKVVQETLDLLSDMIHDSNDTTIQDFVQGKGVEALLYLYLHHPECNVRLCRQAGDLLLQLAQDNTTSTGTSSSSSTAGREGIVNSTALEEIAERMRTHQADTDVQKRGCQLVRLLSHKQYRQRIVESGILKVISKLFDLYRSNKTIITLAHEAMDAIVQ